MRTLVSVGLLFLGLLLPAFASAAPIPQPVIDSYDALLGDDTYKSTFTSKATVDMMGLFKMTTQLKGTGFKDKDGDVEGKTMTTFTMKDSSQKAAEKFSLTMDYKYLTEEGMLYFRFKKLPKSMPEDVTGVRANVWYSSEGDEELARLTGQDSLQTEHFVEANEKYPAVTYKEKGSTKKEYVYLYSVNKSMIENFLNEQWRLDGLSTTTMDLESVVDLLGTAKGTLRIDKKTLLPKSMTQTMDADIIKTDTKITYVFTTVKDVKTPKNAIPSDVMEDLYGTGI